MRDMRIRVLALLIRPAATLVHDGDAHHRVGRKVTHLKDRRQAAISLTLLPPLF